MENKKNSYPWAPIRNLLLVLLSGVLSAVIFAFFMLYNYGPTGRYLLSNALLSPQTISSLSFEDPDLPGSKAPRFKFNEIEYAHWDASKKQWQRIPFSLEDYSHLYQTIAEEKSIVDVSNDVVNYFYSLTPSRLTIFVKAQGDSLVSGGLKKPLQVVEFAGEGNYYRVELRGSEGNAGWAYFYHPKILQEVLDQGVK